MTNLLNLFQSSGRDLKLILTLGVGVVRAADHDRLAHTGYCAATNPHLAKERNAAGFRPFGICEATGIAIYIQQQPVFPFFYLSPDGRSNVDILKDVFPRPASTGTRVPILISL